MLGPGDRDDFVALAERDPVVNVFADYRARLTNLDERWLGGQVWGRFEDDELVAGCHLGANLVPVQCTPADVGAFADAALRRRNSVGTIVGPSDVVASLWELVGMTAPDGEISWLGRGQGLDPHALPEDLLPSG